MGSLIILMCRHLQTTGLQPTSGSSAVKTIAFISVPAPVFASISLSHIPKTARNSLARTLLTGDYILYFLLSLSALRNISGVSPDGHSDSPLLMSPCWKFQTGAVFVLQVSEHHCGKSAFQKFRCTTPAKKCYSLQTIWDSSHFRDLCVDQCRAGNDCSQGVWKGMSNSVIGTIQNGFK